MSKKETYPALLLLPGMRDAIENGAPIPDGPAEIREHFNEYFDIEMDGWVHGVSTFPGEVDKELVHTIIKELKDAFEQAILHFYAFDIVDISLRFSKAAKYLIHEKEVAFAILAQFPHPNALDEDSQFVMAQIIDQVEYEWGGAVERLNRKWQTMVQEAEEAEAA